MRFLNPQAVLALAVFAAPAVAIAQPGGAPAAPGQRQAAPGAAAPAAGGAQLESFNDKLSYAVGLNAGRMLQQQGLNPDPDLFMAGFRDSYKEEAARMTDEEIQEVFAEVQQQMQARAEAAQKEMAAKWDQSFAQQPAAAEQSTESGLKYTVFAQGEGPKPKASDFVVVHYVGKLPDGNVFDSSIRRGEPAVFQLGQVIPGWTEGLQLMSKGAKYRFDIPAELAYGEEGNPPRIPANQNLIFEVELLDVMPAQGPAEGGADGAAGAAGGAAGGAGGAAAGGNRPR